MVLFSSFETELERAKGKQNKVDKPEDDGRPTKCMTGTESPGYCCAMGYIQPGYFTRDFY